MRTAPIMKVAKSMCVWTRTAITTFLPIIGTSRLPIGIRYLLLPRKVDDPAKRQEHVQHDRDDDQKTYGGCERSFQGAVVRPTVEPRQRDEQDDEDRRHYHSPEANESIPREEHQHLLVEEEEPLRAWHVRYSRRVGRLGERRGRDVREHSAGDKDERRDE